MRLWVGGVGCAWAALSLAGELSPDAVSSARGSADAVVHILPGVVRAMGFDAGLAVAATRDEPAVLRAWRHGPRTWSPVGPHPAWPAETPAALGPPCGDVAGAVVPGVAGGWSASICPDGTVQLGRTGSPLRVALADAASGPVLGARWLVHDDDTATLVAWSTSGPVRVSTFRDADVVPVRWTSAWMPAGDPLDWPMPSRRQQDPTPAVRLDVRGPEGFRVVDATVVDGKLALLGEVDSPPAVLLLETTWIVASPRTLAR